jgi:hypothetical protein
LAASNDAELADLLAATAVWDEPTADPVPPPVPPIPEGQTALLYFVSYRPHTATLDTTVGVYDAGGDWVVAVRRTDHGVGAEVLCFERHLLFVDAPAPTSVRLRFEDATRDPAEVTWW